MFISMSIENSKKAVELAAIKCLAFWEPNPKDRNGGYIIDHLVLESLATITSAVSTTATEIEELIKKLFKVTYDQEEILVSGKRLGIRGLIDFVEPEYRGGEAMFRITDNTEAEIRKNHRSLAELEDRVFQKWKSSLLSKYGIDHGSKNRAEKIVQGFKAFVAKLVARHGKESVYLLYPNESKVKDWVNSVKKDVLDGMHDIEDSVREYLKIEIGAFLETADYETKYYLNNLFTSSFTWHLIQIDDDAANSIADVTKGQVLILDNNILISLLGFHGQAMLRSVEKILEVSKKLGFELWVTSRTIEEFYSTVTIKVNHLKTRPPLPRELARLASEVLQGDSIVAEYWREFSENGLSIEQFAAEKMHLNPLLDRLGIKIHKKLKTEIEESTELSEEIATLREACPGPYSDHVAKHDAFHRILIRKLRKSPRYQFSHAGYWFLTHDTKLPVYARAGKFEKGSLPFCITTSQFVQVNRPLLSRYVDSGDFEESFSQLVAKPYFRSILQNFATNEIKERVLGRLSKFENMGVEYAATILANAHFMSSLDANSSDEHIDEKITLQFFSIEEDLRMERDRYKKELEDANEVRGGLETKTAELENNDKANRQKILEIEEKLNLFHLNFQAIKSEEEKAKVEVGFLKNENQSMANALEELSKSKNQIEAKVQDLQRESDKSAFVKAGLDDWAGGMPFKVIRVCFGFIVLLVLYFVVETVELFDFEPLFGIQLLTAKMVKVMALFFLMILGFFLTKDSFVESWRYVFGRERLRGEIAKMLENKFDSKK